MKSSFIWQRTSISTTLRFPPDMQVKDAISSAYENCLSIAGEGDKYKAKDDSSVVEPHTEGSSSEYRHHVQARTIPNDDYMNTYISIPFSLFSVYTFSNRQFFACSFCSITCCKGCFYPRDSADY